MMHIPIYFPGLTWSPTDVMGHPAWGNLAQMVELQWLDESPGIGFRK